jgi:nucleoside-diphosphate-sugar epimerase
MQGVAVVFHCAATTTNNVPWQVHEETNVLGTKAVFEEARKAGVRRVIHTSSVIVYGLDAPRGGVVGEWTALPEKIDRWAHYLRAKLEAEKLAFELHRRADLPVTVLRLGILYGPGGARSIGKGLAQFGPIRLSIGSGRNVLPYTHVDNAVDALLLAAITPAAVGQAYNIVDEPQVTVRDAIAYSTAANGERLLLVPVPPVLLAGAARLLELKQDLAGSQVPPRLSRFVVRSACRNIRYDTAKGRRELGWRSA